jgi:hypothetical protein
MGPFPPANSTPIDWKGQNYFQFEDTRPNARERSNFSGWYRKDLARKLIKKAKEVGVDPETILSMAMLETTFGTQAGQGGWQEALNNPLRYRSSVHEKKVYNQTDDNWDWVPKGPKGKGSAEFWKWYTGDSSSIGKAIDYMKYRTNLPGKNLENYRGTGDFAYNNPNQPIGEPYTPQIEALKRVFRGNPDIQRLLEESE